MLGVCGERADTGKPAGDDLREGRRAVLVARTAQEVGDERVLGLLGTAEGVDELRDLIDSSGARAAVEDDIARLSDQAHAAIAAIGPRAVELLAPLVDAATRRVR